MLKTTLYHIVFFVVILFTSNQSSASLYIDINIYSTVAIYKTDITIFSGKYELYDANKNLICELYKNSMLTIHTKGAKIEIYQDKKLLGQSSSFFLKGTGFLNTFKVSPIKPAYAIRIYDDNLYIKSKNNAITLINNVDLEKYIAGVVESEGGGSTKDIDFFLVQSIACRTYALANIRKHWNDGFHLCDEVHCQVYKGRATLSYVTMATFRTTGKVIVDETNKMISAAFHSNSGGQTMNSEDVWTLKTPYLKSIVDTFSLSMRNAQWEVKMPKNEWLEYLKKQYSYPIDKPEKLEAVLNFSQNSRKVHLADNIPLKDIRRDLQLRSTFFSIETIEDTVSFNGKGYGHGVGMSQEGAIKMIQLGYNYEDVINFYYKNVRIVNFDELDYFFINYNY